MCLVCKLKHFCAASGVSLWWSTERRSWGFFSLPLLLFTGYLDLCRCVLVKITLRYLTLESATVSIIVPIYRDICIISQRTCMAVQHIDRATGRQWETGGKERDYNGLGFAEQQPGGENRYIGLRGWSISYLISWLDVKRPLRGCSKYLPNVLTAAAGRVLYSVQMSSRELYLHQAVLTYK